MRCPLSTDPFLFVNSPTHAFLTTVVVVIVVAGLAIL